MTIVKATHYELGTLTKTEYFADLAIAQSHTSDWGVTDWGKIYFEEIEVTDR